MTGKVFIRTFGCQMNEYDSDKMADVLNAARGMERTDDPAQADVILFNTCSVREKAQEKVFHDLGRVKHLKRVRPEVLIGVGGCVASQEGGAIVARAPYVDLVFGPQTLHRLPALIDERLRTGQMTDWRGGDGQPLRGVGQRMLQIGEEDRPLLEIQTLELRPAPV